MTGAPIFPVGLVVQGRRCLVVGGGDVAARKIRQLLRCGADVTVVAPEAHRAIGQLASDGTLAAITGGPLDLQLRGYRPGEASEYRLVITATGSPEVDETVRRDAEASGVWVNSADDISNCTFVLPAVHRDGPVTVAVSTGGASPALASWLKQQIAAFLGPGLGPLADLLGEARVAVIARGLSTDSVDWAAMLEGELPGLVREGRIDEARSLVRRALDSPTDDPEQRS